MFKKKNPATPSRPDPATVAAVFGKALSQLIDEAERNYARPYALESALEAALVRVRMGIAARPR